MKILHVIRAKDDPLADQVIETIGEIEDADQTLLMIQDGVYIRSHVLRAFACSDDVLARGIETDLPLVDQEEIVDMIFDHDRVVTW